MVKRLLMVAFHYPPAQASGTQRALSFSYDLPEFGWEPILLTAHPRAYEKIDADSIMNIPPDLRVHRTFALDAARHLAIKGRYSRLTAWPDRWANWYWSAIPVGLYLIFRYKPKAIWTTYPLATTLNIGYTLHKITGLPWVVDLRDPMVSGHHPHDPALKKVFAKIERKTVTHGTRIVVSTPGLQRFLAARYPELPEEKWLILPNGFNEKSFRNFIIPPKWPHALQSPLTLVHSGTLYTGANERHPGPFLQVLAQLRDQGIIGATSENSPNKIGLRVILRATGNDATLNAMIKKRGLDTIVTTAPSLPYQEAIKEMMQADGLLLFQGEAFNHLIPAKLFEYLRTGRPLFALTGAKGDSARILHEAGLDSIAPMEDEKAIYQPFKNFLEQLRQGRSQLPNPQVVAGYSRREQSQRLATLLDAITLNPSNQP